MQGASNRWQDGFASCSGWSGNPDLADMGLPSSVGLWSLVLNAYGQIIELIILTRPNIMPNSQCGLGAEAKLAQALSRAQGQSSVAALLAEVKEVVVIIWLGSCLEALQTDRAIEVVCTSWRQTKRS